MLDLLFPRGVTLDDYQVDLVNKILSYTRQRPDRINPTITVFGSPTGSGKTLVLRTASTFLMTCLQQVTRTLVAVPQNQIKESWGESLTVAFPENKCEPIEVCGWYAKPTDRHDGVNDWDDSSSKACESLMAWFRAAYPPELGRITTHQALARWAKNPKFFPTSCTKMLLIVDEAHWMSEDTLLTQAAMTFMERGGIVIPTTATPWTDEGPLFEDAAIVLRTLGEHMESGRYAPSKIVVRTAKVTGKATRAQQLVFDHHDKDSAFDPSADPLRPFRDAARQWVMDGCPKSIFLVASGSSLHDADLLKKALTEGIVVDFEPGKEAEAHDLSMRLARFEGEVEFDGQRRVVVRVEPDKIHPAVGPNPRDQRALANHLRAERRNASSKPSAYHCFIACRRFDEGTDWPHASHIYCFGLTSKLRRALQWLGRVMRLKLGNNFRPPLFDYRDGQHYQQFGDTAVITFFLPSHAEQAWQQLRRHQHRDIAFLIGSLIHDIETGLLFVGQVREDQLSARTRSRSGNKPVSGQAWADILDGINTDQTNLVEDFIAVNQTHFNKLHTLWRKAMFHIGKRKPTDAEVMDYLQRGMSLSGDEAIRARLVKQCFAIMRPQHRNVLRALKGRVTHELEGAAVSERLVRKTLQKCFDQFADELEASNDLLMQEAEGIVAHVSEMTGISAAEIADHLREALPDNPQLTDDQIRAVVEDFYDQTGDIPNPHSGHVGRFVGGWNTTFQKINAQLGRRTPKASLKILCEEMFGSGVNPTGPVDTSAMGAQLRAVYEALTNGNWHTLADLTALASGTEAGVSARIRDLRKNPYCLVIERRQNNGSYEYRLASTGNRLKYQDDFEAFHRSQPEVLDTIITTIIQTITGPTSVRQAVNTIRGSGTAINDHFPVFYARIVPALVPVLASRLQVRLRRDGQGDYVPDWDALGIDPNDPKWDDYQTRAGGSLPRYRTTKSQQQLAFEKAHQSRKDIFEILAEEYVRRLQTDNMSPIAIRLLDGARRAAGAPGPYIDTDRLGFYAVILAALVPALDPLIDGSRKTQWIEDWGALGIDPNDPKWDDYHVRAGGSLPRAVNGTKNGTKNGTAVTITTPAPYGPTIDPNDSTWADTLDILFK